MDNRAIGMFDSGVGGVAVFSEIVKLLPNENIIYLGDTERFPYGSKTRDNIIELTTKNLEFLVNKNVKMVVIACGTASSQALDEVRKVYSIPILGVIDPTIDSISKREDIKQIGVMATNGTINSGIWERKIKEVNPNIQVVSKKCPLLAPMAEEGWTENEIAKLAIKEYTKDLQNIKQIILGCTHYPLFKQTINSQLGEDVELIDMGEKMAMYLKNYLYENNLQNDSNITPNYEFYLTDIETNFKQIVYNLTKNQEIVNSLKKVDIH